MEIQLSGKATGRMWIGMDSTSGYRPNRRTRYEVLEAVQRTFGVTFTDIVGERRHKKLVRARQLAAYFLRVCTPMSTPQIGWALGQRDHSTICHALERVRHKTHGYEPELSEIAVSLGIVAPFPPLPQKWSRGHKKVTA